jgi:RNA polymerase sigma-32 factor
MDAHRRAGRSTGTIERAAQAAPLLSAAEEFRLARRARQGDAAAFDQLVRAHLRLVLATAFHFRSYGTPLDDLLAEGVLGLVKAARGYDPDRGVRFATYANFWIRAYLRRCTMENRRIVRGPSTRAARKLQAGMRKTERRLEAGGGRADRDAVARELGVSAFDVDEVRAALSGRDVPYDVELNGRRFELASSAPSPEALAEDREQERVYGELLESALARLKPRARRILELRCLGADASTLGDLSEELGISRERVRQIEAQAKAQVRAAIADALQAARLPALEVA